MSAAEGLRSSSALVLLLGRGAGRSRRAGREPSGSSRPARPSPRAELVVLAAARPRRRCRDRRSSSSTRSTGSPHQTQLLGLALGLAFAVPRRGADRRSAKRLVVDRGARGGLPAERAPEEQEAIVRDRRRERQPAHAHAACSCSGCGAAGGALGARARSRPLASLGPVLDIDSLYRHAVAPRPPARRRGRPALAAPRDRGGRLLHRVPRGRRPRSSSASPLVARPAAAGGARPAARARAAARPSGIVAYSKICTHAGCAISLYRAPLFQPDEPRPALVCPCHYSTFDPATGGTVHVRPRRAQAADAAARRSTRRATCAPPAPSTGRSARRGGASGCGGRARDPPRSSASRPAHRQRAAPAQDAALPLPRPLVVPARRGRALRVHRARRDGHLPDALLRATARSDVVYHGPYAPLQGQHDERGVPLGASTSRST